MAPSSKVPIYPRPVSPLSAESIYGNSQPSSDDYAYSRAAKRRRIEKLGEQYLRGDGLHILSAGLQGPFNSKWKNPWCKRGRAAKQAVAEIPETAGRPAKQPQAQKSGHAKARDSKVEEWLRRSSAYAGLEIEEQSSPTPVRKQAKTFSKAATEDVVYGPVYQLGPDFEKSKVVADLGPREPDAQPIADSPGGADCARHLEAEDAHTKRRAWVSHAANADRAEFAALKSKRRVVEIAPSTSILSPFEYRRSSDGVHKPREFEEVTNELQEEVPPMQPPPTTEPRGPHGKEDGEVGDPTQDHGAAGGTNLSRAVTTVMSPAVPALSTDTSRGSVANLPSAQPQSLNVPAPSTNNLAFEKPAPEQQSEPATITEAPPQNRIGEESKTAPYIPGVNNHGSKLISGETAHLKDKASDGPDPIRLPAIIAAILPDTQDMLAGMSPLNFSTIKKAASGFPRLATPVTVTKQRPEKPRKNASFAQGERFSAGSSQGSLKASLRISKAASSVAATPAVGKENEKVYVGEENTNGELEGSVTWPTKKSPLPATSFKGLKSVMKPSGPPIRTVPFTSTKGSTSTGVDGGQNVAVMEDDAFDLEGTMDDLGSYLDTWDVEKEASSMDMDT
jgi:hypothetical protein